MTEPPSGQVPAAMQVEIDAVQLVEPGAPTTAGQRLAALRQASGLSQSALAGPGGQVSASMISLIEADKRRPGPQVLAHLARRLGVSIAALTGAESSAVRTPGERGVHQEVAPRWCITMRVRVRPSAASTSTLSPSQELGASVGQDHGPAPGPASAPTPCPGARESPCGPSALSAAADAAARLDLPERTYDVQARDLRSALSQLIELLD